MKATLEFKLPEEEREHHDAINGSKWKILYMDFERTLRNYQKHGHEFTDVDDCLDKLRDEMWADAEAEGLSLLE